MTPTQIRWLLAHERSLFAAWNAIIADQCSRAPLFRRWQANGILSRLERMVINGHRD